MTLAQGAHTDPIEEPANLLKDALQRLLENRLAVLGGVIIVLFVLASLIGPLILPYDFLEQDLAARNALPSLNHLLGTDDLGRDLLSRVVYGGRTALLVAIVVTATAVAIGIVLGAVAGYLGGKIDAFIMWLTDMTMSVPSLLLVVVINASLKPFFAAWMEAKFEETRNAFYRDTGYIDLGLLFFTIALIKWPQYARLMRGQVLIVRNSNYVLAAKALGLSTRVIISRFIIPNTLGPIIVAVSFGIGTAMVLESSFSFLGVGVQPPTPSWGRMISDGLRSWSTYPHLLVVPAVTLGIVTVAFALFGDGLNNALNPKARR